MSNEHLDDRELELLLVEGELPGTRMRHLRGCLACRSRHEGFLAVVARSAEPDPERGVVDRVRSEALRSWRSGEGSGRHAAVRRWLAAAAAIVVAAALVVAGRLATEPRPQINAEAVLEEVDDVLSSDPLAAFVSEDVIDVVIPGEEGGSES